MGIRIHLPHHRHVSNHAQQLPARAERPSELLRQLRAQIVHFSIDRLETAIEPLLDCLETAIELLIERVDRAIEPPNLAEQMIPMSGQFFHSSLEYIEPRLL